MNMERPVVFMGVRSLFLPMVAFPFVTSDRRRLSSEDRFIESQQQSETDASPRSPFPNRWAMFKAAFWHDLDMLRWLAHVIAPIPVLLYLNKTLGVWVGASVTYGILALSVLWPPMRLSILDSMPRSKTLFSVFFGSCLLLTNTVAAGAATALLVRELGGQGRSIVIAVLAGGCACVILSLAIRTPFRELFHIPPVVRESIRDALKDDEPSEAPKDEASRFDDGNSTPGPRCSVPLYDGRLMKKRDRCINLYRHTKSKSLVLCDVGRADKS